MEIETDHDDDNLLGHGVWFSVCKSCGEKFAKDMQHPKRTVCPKCRRLTKWGTTAKQKTAASFREMKRSEEIEEKKSRERQLRRDASWSRWERENGFAPRFEDNGDKLVEIRGRVG